jgi:ATP-dependent Lon protease
MNGSSAGRSSFYLKVGGDALQPLHLELSCGPAAASKDLCVRLAAQWLKQQPFQRRLGARSFVAARASGPPERSPPAGAPPAAKQRPETGRETGREDDEALLRGLSAEETLYCQGLPAATKALLLESLRAVRRDQSVCAPLKMRLLASGLPVEIKKKVLQRLEKQRESLYNGEAIKYATWVESMIAAASLQRLVPVALEPPQLLQHLFAAKAHLDAVIYGHRAAKQAILERFFLWLKHPLAPQRPLALRGCPGNGKTSLVKEGLAKIMGRPFCLIALGGALDSSYMLGHAYTYEGSCQGRLADALVSSECQNPVLFFDELDKCSSTPKGEEVVNTLLHVTDSTQNASIRDRYLAGLDLDVSCAMLVFSFNDDSKVSPVLLDRLQVVPTDSFSAADQVNIMKQHLLPKILTERGLGQHCLQLSQEAGKEAVACCKDAGGVRALRSLLEQLVTKVCIFDETQGDEQLTHPLRRRHLKQLGRGSYQLQEGAFLELLKEERRRAEPPVGMYA